MRIIFTMLVIGFAVAISGSQSVAQTVGGVSGISGVNAGGFTGSVNFGGFNFDPVGGFGVGGRRRRSQSQPAIDPILARKLQQQAENQQIKRNLIQLAQNNRANSTQSRFAYQEAKSDYQAIRSGQIAASSIGAIGTPFRLTSREINWTRRDAQWPSALQQNQEFEVMVELLDDAIKNDISTTKEANQFLADLERLNQSLNLSAANGRINIKDYANSRRFITGLANEVRASNLLM